MKKIICLFLSLVLLSLSLISCSSEKIEKMKYNDEGFLEGDKATYNYAPVGYEPTSQDAQYGLIDGVLEEKLYRIGDIDPEKWLTTEYTGSTTTVYYSSDITLPTLSEMNPELCYVCEQGDNIYSIYTLGDPENEKVDVEREIIGKIIEILCDENVESSIWPRGEGKETYNLKMYSDKWPAIYYNLVYVREGENNYVYDRVTKRCVNIGDLIEGCFEKA